MKRFLTTAAALVLLAGSTGAVLAQRDNNRHDDHAPAMQSRGMQNPGMQNHGMAMRGPGDNNRHNWRKGGRIERNDWNRGQRVDYRSHHLQRPPRGYEWRRVDNNYVLAAAATGLIASILLANQ